MLEINDQYSMVGKHRIHQATLENFQRIVGIKAHVNSWEKFAFSKLGFAFYHYDNQKNKLKIFYNVRLSDAHTTSVILELIQNEDPKKGNIDIYGYNDGWEFFWNMKPDQAENFIMKLKPCYGMHRLEPTNERLSSILQFAEKKSTSKTMNDLKTLLTEFNLVDTTLILNSDHQFVHHGKFLRKLHKPAIKNITVHKLNPTLGFRITEEYREAFESGKTSNERLITRFDSSSVPYCIGYDRIVFRMLGDQTNYVIGILSKDDPQLISDRLGI